MAEIWNFCFRIGRYLLENLKIGGYFLKLKENMLYRNAHMNGNSNGGWFWVPSFTTHITLAIRCWFVDIGCWPDSTRKYSGGRKVYFLRWRPQIKDIWEAPHLGLNFKHILHCSLFFVFKMRKLAWHHNFI